MTLRHLLVVSLAGNLLLLGMMVGLALPHLNPPAPPPSKAETTLRTLPPERRALIEDRIGEMRRRLRENDHAEERRLAVTYRLRAPVFDRAAWQEALRAMFDERDRQRDQMVDEIGDLAETLSQPERVALSRLLDENRPRPPRH